MPKFDFKSFFDALINKEASDKTEFETWYKVWSKLSGMNPDPYDPKHYYDYLGAWKAGLRPKPGEHWPDTFKLPGHPTFSVESQYYRPGMKAGKWQGEKFIPFEEWSKE